MQSKLFPTNLLKNSIANSAFPLSILEVSLIAVLLVWGISRQIETGIEKKVIFISHFTLLFHLQINIKYGSKAKSGSGLLSILLKIFNDGFSGK
jgi:hypothetical protein